MYCLTVKMPLLYVLYAVTALQSPEAGRGVLELL